MKVSALLSLVPLASALPGRRAAATPDTNAPFSVIAAHSGSPIHLTPLSASGSHFYLGSSQSQTYCPSEVVSGCSKRTNETILIGTNFLDVVVPGGQSIYVDPSGALSFTSPHSGYIPPGSSQGPFQVKPGQNFGSWTYSGEGASGFMACPVPAVSATAASRHVFAALQNATVPTGKVSDCLGFDALAVNVNVTSDALAWEYI
ncbi:hypothetical protein N7462_000953 [Penicillium macrosclerotiorum]|uniref:uncharacterized protein n=1 Tax=Penicillium macrosclerotiorum TaxID=303699 RepID=UPI00254740D8|nr:uncharacterized protein N7462_000953 [Penicillium macrosclerotiorum]KAJ5698948.1 hypothetical protein N7462_000953 [Penicillium macrosclerotiorum]